MLELDYNNVLSVTINHGDRDLRQRKAELAKTISRKIKRGDAVYRDVLANSGVMRQLFRDAKKCHRAHGGEKWGDKEYEDMARKVSAEEILAEAYELLEN